VSEKALAIAQENANLNEVDISFLKIDVLQKKNWIALPKFNVIVSNPPYIPTKESHLMPSWVKDYEPSLALFVENDDPLLFYRTIGKLALTHLQKGGSLFFETNEFNASEVQDLLKELGYGKVKIEKDLFGKDRMVVGCLSK